MKPYFAPSRKMTFKKIEEDLKKNKKNGRRPQKKMKMENNLNLFLEN
jgi:hypothetical protein